MEIIILAAPVYNYPGRVDYGSQGGWTMAVGEGGLWQSGRVDYGSQGGWTMAVREGGLWLQWSIYSTLCNYAYPS